MTNNVYANEADALEMSRPPRPPSAPAAHTPGPWIESAKRVGGVVAENYREITGGAEYEPQSDDPSKWGYECLRIVGYISPANARLIAAAPDLLALARQYLTECGECAGVGITIDDEPCDECAELRAVIAKAEGRS